MSNTISHLAHPGSVHHAEHITRPTAREVSLEPAQNLTDQLKQQIESVNTLQQDASRAIEDIAASRRSDLESVMLAKDKADAALSILLDVRNQVARAYEQMNQVRV